MRIGGRARRKHETPTPRPARIETRQASSTPRHEPHRLNSRPAPPHDTETGKSKQGRRNDGHGARRPAAGHERNHGTHAEQRAARDDGTQIAPPDDKQGGARERMTRRADDKTNDDGRNSHGANTDDNGTRWQARWSGEPRRPTTSHELRRRRSEASNGDDARQDRRR